MDVEDRCKKTGEYWDWVRLEAKRINSDGCTRSFEIGECCCLEHDLGFRYGRDPREAFKLQSWPQAPAISFAETNRRFRACLPFFLKYRYLGVSWFGKPLWDRARLKDPEWMAKELESK